MRRRLREGGQSIIAIFSLGIVTLMDKFFAPKPAFKVFLLVLTAAWFFLYLQNLNVPLQGTHQWRQADTLFSAYFFCTEKSDILHPKIGPRQNTSGVAIGEFPIFSWTVGHFCQLKGGWDEASPKIINFLIYFLTLLAWWVFVKNQFQLKNLRFHHWFALCFFASTSLSFLTIPMPEATALLFFGISGALWSQKPSRRTDLGGMAAFVFGFLLRPYHIPFLVLFRPRRALFVPTLALCVLVYWAWYRYWPSRATEIWGYYGIQFESFDKILAALPKALAAVPKRILEHTHLFGLLLFWPVFKRQPLLVLLYLGSFAMMFALKPTHLPYHGYYLINAAFLAVVIMTLGLEMISGEARRAAFLAVFMVWGVSSTFHYLRLPDARRSAQTLSDFSAAIPAEAKVATFTGSPQALYWMKRTGWALEPAAFQGASSCPEGASYYVLKGEDQSYKMEKCVHESR